jgi:hypothetical protein
MPSFNNLGGSLIERLYAIVNGGDSLAPANPNNFISWCSPGIPFDKHEFDFCHKGLAAGTTPEELRALELQAYNLSAMLDFIPEPPRPNRDSSLKTDQLVFRSSQNRLSHIYSQILRASKVVSQDLSAQERDKINLYRKRLMVTKVREGEEPHTEPSPMKLDYDRYSALYDTAKLEYNNKRIAAATATGSDLKAVQDWQFNGELYREKLRRAEDDWITFGFREEIRQINAFIGNLGLRDLQVWKRALLEHLEHAQVNGLNGPFPYTTLIPGNFAEGNGWTSFSFNEDHIKTKTNYATNGWGGSLGATFGLFNANAEVDDHEKHSAGTSNISTFRMEFELAQVVVSRPWFFPEFFSNRGWTLEPGAGWTFDDLPSDGQMPPKGIFVAYPTMVLFARNIRIQSEEFVRAYDEFSHETGVDAAIGFGPFHLGGKYSKTQGETNNKVDRSGASLLVPGMQAIGFINHLTGKAPNPDPSIPVERFE